MNHEIICSSFPITDSIRNIVEEHLGDLQTFSSKPFFFHVYLTKIGPKEFQVKLQSRLWHKDILAEAKDRDLYHAMSLAKQHFRKLLIKENQKHKTAG